MVGRSNLFVDGLLNHLVLAWFSATGSAIVVSSSYYHISVFVSFFFCLVMKVSCAGVSRHGKKASHTVKLNPNFN